LKNSDDKTIILIADVLEQKLRKEKELEFYNEELEKLQQKIFWLEREVKLTEKIIEIIHNEQHQ
jgi:hypothetical protein